MFQIFPFLVKGDKGLEKYEKPLHKTTEVRDIPGFEKLILEIKGDEKVTPETKEVLDTVHKEAMTAMEVKPQPQYERDYLRLLYEANDLAKIHSHYKRRGWDKEAAEVKAQAEEKLAQAEELRKQDVESKRLKSSYELALERHNIEMDKKARAEAEAKGEVYQAEEKPVSKEAIEDVSKEGNIRIDGTDDVTTFTIKTKDTSSYGEMRGDVLVMGQTEVAPESRGQGLGPKAVEDIVSKAQEKNPNLHTVQGRAVSEAGYEMVKKRPGVEFRDPITDEVITDEGQILSYIRGDEGVPYSMPVKPKPQAPAPKPKVERDPDVAGLSHKLKVEAVTAGIKADLEHLTGLEHINHADQAKRSVDLDTKNPERAEDIATGRVEPGKGEPMAIAVYNAVKQRAIATDNIPLIRELGLSKVATVVSKAAQTLGMVERNPLDPVEAVNTLAKKRSEVQDKTGKAERETKKLEKSIKEKAPKKEAWDDFLSSLEC
jgi:hypothetical protein